MFTETIMVVCVVFMVIVSLFNSMLFLCTVLHNKTKCKIIPGEYDEFSDTPPDKDIGTEEEYEIEYIEKNEYFYLQKVSNYGTIRYKYTLPLKIGDQIIMELDKKNFIQHTFEHGNELNVDFVPIYFDRNPEKCLSRVKEIIITTIDSKTCGDILPERDSIITW